ncbi:hypothetical protein J31TS4_02950 [Paenibacillus sp. J31TS4]|uniref:PASTA domain-containing protein n=1 Tax=Paenibacillus sp. J31TS4 TaxID=2807195 RepID=UPI001B26B7E9|nr:PASTA domain-containing protein [Paenibacillus sp. J31TS4]GIP37015.1 hypothetical protein J31TS4_02950 [Paenibacillus sp. J31TS4]
MSHTMGNRYAAHSQIQPLSGGALYYGEDKALPREVLLYHTERPGGSADDDYARAIRRASTLNHNGFQHILDSSFDEASVLVVLQHRPGKPLIQELRTRIWTYPKIIHLATGVGLAMLDALEGQVGGYPASADNLWLGEDGRLSFLNYWEEGPAHTQGAMGLCSLMLQLFSGAEQMPRPCESLDPVLGKVGLFQATPEQKETFAELVRRVCSGRMSLPALVFELRGLQKQLEQSTKPQPVYGNAAVPAPAAASEQEHARPAQEEAAAPRQPRTPAAAPEAAAPAAKPDARASSGRRTEAPVPAPVEEPVDEEPAKPWFYKKSIVIGSAVIVVGFLVWVFWPSADPARRPLFEGANPAPSVQTSASPKPTASAKPTERPSAPPTQTPPPVADGTVPTLVGLPRADAESTAIAAGYRYNFLMEPNEQPEGTVFKQTPEPGASAEKGSNITFWVSKGPQ